MAFQKPKHVCGIISLTSCHRNSQLKCTLNLSHRMKSTSIFFNQCQRGGRKLMDKAAGKIHKKETLQGATGVSRQHWGKLQMWGVTGHPKPSFPRESTDVGSQGTPNLPRAAADVGSQGTPNPPRAAAGSQGTPNLPFPEQPQMWGHRAPQTFLSQSIPPGTQAQGLLFRAINSVRSN